jgi:FeS assembly SUF system protein
MDRAGSERSDAANGDASEATPLPAETPEPMAGGAVATELSAPRRQIDPSLVEAEVIDALCTVYDPEIPVNIYELGLIYDLDVSPDGTVKIDMTLTSPACPVAGSLPGEVEAKVREVSGVEDVSVELVWDPPWTPDRMTEAARLELGFM